jgi:hypothetical protein
MAFPRFEYRMQLRRVRCSTPRKPSYLGSNIQAGSLNGWDRTTGTMTWTRGKAVSIDWGIALVNLVA